MASNRPHPMVYLFPAVALVAVLVYYLYGAVDRLGLETRHAEAVVTGKEIAQGSTTYRTTTVGGRAWTQSVQNPDAHVLMFEVDGEATGGAVSPEMYESVKPGDRVRVRFQRTRVSDRLLVTDVSR